MRHDERIAVAIVIALLWWWLVSRAVAALWRDAYARGVAEGAAEGLEEGWCMAMDYARAQTHQAREQEPGA